MTVRTLREPKLDAARDAKRAVGRPKKAPARGKRASLSLLVRPEIKRRVDELATINGITQSAQAGFLIEQGIAVRQVLDAMGKTLAELERGNVDSALPRLGYQPWRWRETVDGKTWTAWCEPGHPLAGRISVGGTL